MKVLYIICKSPLIFDMRSANGEMEMPPTHSETKVTIANYLTIPMKTIANYLSYHTLTILQTGKTK